MVLPDCAMADIQVFEYERDDGVKRSKPNWPPGPVGYRFYVSKTDSFKWPLSSFIRSESRVMFVVTVLGIQCCQSGCSTRNFGEAEKQGMTSYTSSLFHCDKHIGAFHPPPSREAPTIAGFFKKKTRVESISTSSSSSFSSQKNLHGDTDTHTAAPDHLNNATSGATSEQSLTIRQFDGATYPGKSHLITDSGLEASLSEGVTTAMKCLQSRGLSGCEGVVGKCVTIGIMTAFKSLDMFKNIHPTSATDLTEIESAPMLQSQTLIAARVHLPCPGFLWPGDLPFADNYPFGRHSLADPLNFTARADGCIFSTNPPCEVLSLDGAACASCAQLKGDVKLSNIVERSQDQDLYLTPIQNSFLTQAQMQQRYNHQAQRLSILRLYVHKKNKRITSLLGRIDDFKLVLVALSENKINRVHAVLAQALKRRLNLNEVITRAIQKKYAATRNKDKDELDKALLICHISPRLLFTMTQTDGFAARSSVQRLMFDVPRFISCVCDIELHIIFRNMDRFIFETPVPEEKCLWHLAMDATVTEELYRASLNDPYLRGLCQCAAKSSVSLFPKSIADIRLLQDEIEKGNIHLASEVLVCCLIPNRRENYAPLVVCAHGTCKRADAAFCKRIQECIIQRWNSDPKGSAARGPLSTSQTDGASVMAASAHSLFDNPFSEDDMPPCPQAEIFVRARLFPKYCGRGNCLGVVDGRDAKHVVKRFKTRANTKTMGFMLLSKFAYVRAYLRAIIKEASLLSDPQLAEIFNEGGADAQNVAAAIRLILALSSLGKMKPADFPARDPGQIKETLKDLRILGEYASCFERFFLGKELTLEAHLDNLSTMSHLLFALFRKNDTKFVPAQQYSNTQRMIRAIFWSVATAQVNGIANYFPFLDSTDPLEQNFGIIRDLHGPGNQVDLIQYEDRQTAAMSIQSIYARHPDWKPTSRRLETSLDHMNPRSWLL